MLAIRESCEIASIWLLVSNYSSPFSPFCPFQSSPSSSLVNTCYGVSRSSSLSTSFLYQRYASRFPLHIRTRPREYRTYSSYSIRGKSSVVVWASDPISSRVRSINVRIYFTRKIPLIELRLSNHFVSSSEVETFSEEKFLRLFHYKLSLGRKLQIEEIVCAIIDFVFSRKKLRRLLVQVTVSFVLWRNLRGLSIIISFLLQRTSHRLINFIFVKKIVNLRFYLFFFFWDKLHRFLISLRSFFFSINLSYCRFHLF